MTLTHVTQHMVQQLVGSGSNSHCRGCKVLLSCQCYVSHWHRVLNSLGKALCLSQKEGLTGFDQVPSAGSFRNTTWQHIAWQRTGLPCSSITAWAHASNHSAGPGCRAACSVLTIVTPPLGCVTHQVHGLTCVAQVLHLSAGAALKRIGTAAMRHKLLTCQVAGSAVPADNMQATPPSRHAEAQRGFKLAGSYLS